MKKIVHFQIPYKDGTPEIPFETLKVFVDVAKSLLSDDYYVLTTPLTPSDTEYIYNIPLDNLYKISEENWDSFIISELDKCKRR